MRELLLAMLLTANLLPALAVAASSVIPGQPAPDFVLKNTAGDNVRLSESRGDVVLLSFWAGWCGRCADQLQQLEQLQKAYAPQGVRVIAVNIDRETQPVRDAAGRWNLAVLHDADQSVARQYELTDLPLTVLVDPHGKVRYVHEKYRGGDAALYAEELAALLQE
jgi:peroxiredoxin